MHPATSILLDAIRFGAACIVFLSHITSREFNTVLPWVRWGHEAVVVFFVISGFVIAFVINTRENTAFHYATARLGRLYSVIIPSLALTVILDVAGRHLDPGWYTSIPNDQFVLRLAVNFFFLQQIWNLTVSPLSNGPFWSLSYEFWYYVIFGAWCFTKRSVRALSIAILCVIVGPRILSFLPLWLCGVAAYKIYSIVSINLRIQRAVFLASTLAIVGIGILGNPLTAPRVSFQLFFPDRYFHLAGMDIFIGDIPRLPEDFLLATFIAALIITSRSIDAWIPYEFQLIRGIKYCAGSTFTLYLFHAPLLYFFSAAFSLDSSSPNQIFMLGAMVFSLCLVFAYIGERQLSIYRKLISFLLRKLLEWISLVRSKL